MESGALPKPSTNAQQAYKLEKKKKKKNLQDLQGGEYMPSVYQQSLYINNVTVDLKLIGVKTI